MVLNYPFWRRGGELLADQLIKTVMCEVNEEESELRLQIINLMQEQGFTLFISRHAPWYDNYHYAPSFNYLF